jgi:hypothetical protein
MDRAIPRTLLSAALLLLPGAAFAAEPGAASGPTPPAPVEPAAKAPAPAAPQAIRPLPPANPFGELGAAGVVGGTFSLAVLIGCAASDITPPAQSQCLLASGLTALGLIGVGVPLILIGRSRNVAVAPRVTFTAGARGGVLGYSGSF